MIAESPLRVLDDELSKIDFLQIFKSKELFFLRILSDLSHTLLTVYCLIEIDANLIEKRALTRITFKYMLLLELGFKVCD